MQKRVIVVDNDDDILQIIRFILEEQGYLVEAVSDILSFNKLGDIQPDLILLDDWLSDGYGHLLCRALKQNSQTKTIPVLLISAKNDIETLAAKSHADDYIAKPFDLDFFMNKVRSWLSPHKNPMRPD
ncbi:PleD family two-component system response regulator [Mucilaginibacter rubeus]|uniref:Response regulator transcription factor n=1 Tax=Mucilaginibacter rubeus TaxID=2027860 RepID=A0A5C1HWR2_9SPHI|nr:response regulator [Mucilaginibacter rubeus]QEM09943.1 response regulator transcription factor [Mucilaginibacter rubeus]